MSETYVTRKNRGRITNAKTPRNTSENPMRAGSAPNTKGRGFTSAPERCPKCKEAVVGVRKCKCQGSRRPTGMVWVNGILRYLDGCPNCGGTLHTLCNRKVVNA